MKIIFKLISHVVFLAFFLVFICIPVSIVFLCIDENPLIQQNAKLTFDNIKEAKRIINENRPKRLYSNRKKTLHLSEGEINLLLSYAISQGLGSESLFSRVKVMNNSANITMTAKLPKRFFGDYINLRLNVEKSEHLIDPGNCQIGQLKIPKVVLTPLISFLHRSLLKTARYADLWSHTKNIDQIDLKNKNVTVRYRLNYGTIEDIKDTGRTFLIPDDQQKRLILYYNHLSMLTQSYKTKQNAMVPIIKGMISFAQMNTQTSHDPVLENRTAIQVLSLYSVGTRLDRILAKKYHNIIKSVYRTQLKFHNRSDLPKHFFVSAALTVSTGSKFANLIGLAKEIEDSDGGSGFSFADLAADKAGVLFGELAIATSNSANLFQEKIGHLKNEVAIMPSISNLPEGISQLEFKATYKDLDSKTYRLINLEIESRLRQCELYRN